MTNQPCVRKIRRGTTRGHFSASKRVLRYVVWTRIHGLHFTRNEGGCLRHIGYSDADLAGDVGSRESTSCIVFFLGGNPISWQSSRQRVVAVSSCEAEYVAAASAACQGVWLARLLSDMTRTEIESLELRTDSQPAIALSKNSVFHDRSNHIDVGYHFIRDCVEEGRIRLTLVGIEEQWSIF